MVKPGRKDAHQLREELTALLGELAYLVSVVVVEGPRDVQALRNLGFRGRIEVCSRVSLSDADLVESLAGEGGPVLLLTDFDEEGSRMHRQLTRLLERRGVRLEPGLRRRFGRLMASYGTYAIEDIDNVART